jgi:hypothetical protein
MFGASGIVLGVGQPNSPPVDPLSDMGRADARSAQICRPDSVTQFFQISRYSIEPFTSVFAARLFAKDDCRATLVDEGVELRPEVPFVFLTAAFTGTRNRLTRHTCGPDAFGIRDSREPEGFCPSGNSGKEMTLPVLNKVFCLDVRD